MRKKVWLLAVICVMLIWETNLVLAETKKELPRKERLGEIWEEILRADNLMSARQFLDGEYSQAFWHKVAILTSDVELQNKYLPAIKKGTIFEQVHTLPPKHQKFVYAGYLGWYTDHRNKRLARGDETVNGNSERYKIVLADLPKNDRYFKDKEADLLPPALFKTPAQEAVNRDGYFNLGDYGDLDLYPGGYNVDNNHLIIDTRVLLPPALWLVFMHHEERHSCDDIVTYKNNPPRPPNKKAMINFEVGGYAAGLFTWKLLSEEFMASWRKLALDYNPDFLNAKLILVELLIAEPLFDQYLLGHQSGLEKHIEEAMEMK